VVGDLGDEVEGTERDPGREKRLDGRLATEATTLGAGRQPYFEAGRHLPGTLPELVQEELVLKRQIADATHRSLIARVGEYQRNLQPHPPPRQNGNLEGAAHFGDPARGAFVVVDARCELAVEERSTRHERIDELAVDVDRSSAASSNFASTTKKARRAGSPK